MSINTWSEEDQRLLIEHYQPNVRGANDWLMEKLGRSAKSVQVKYATLRKRNFEIADRRKINRKKAEGWSEEDTKFVMENYNPHVRGGNNWIAEKLNRTVRQVRERYYLICKQNLATEQDVTTNQTHEEIAPIGRTGFYTFEMT